MLKHEEYEFNGQRLIGDPRFVRQQDILPQDLLHQLEVAVVGVGAGGRPCALTLGAIGINKLTLIDPDTIEEHNCSLQGYPVWDVERPKVESLWEDIERVLGPAHWIDGYRQRDKSENWNILRSGKIRPHIIICGVDSMEVRKDLWTWVRSECPSCRLFLDGRMSAETVRVLAIPMNNGEARDRYAVSLYTDEEAFQDRCTAVGTMHSAAIAGNMLVLQATKWIRGRGLPLCTDIVVNLLTWDVVRLGPEHTCVPIEL